MSQEILLHSGNSSGDSIEQLMQRYGIPQTRSAYLSMYFAPDEVPDKIPVEVELSIPAKYRILPRGFVTPTSLHSAQNNTSTALAEKLQILLPPQ